MISVYLLLDFLLNAALGWFSFFLGLGWLRCFRMVTHIYEHSNLRFISNNFFFLRWNSAS